MKKISLLLLFISVAGCSNIKDILVSANVPGIHSNPLKSIDDVHIEKLLVGGKWLYQHQKDDCKDTYWTQQFYQNKYYKSGGSSCLLANTFSVDAESWHVKNRVLYIVNLSPQAGADIILKYGVSRIDDDDMVLKSGKYTYTFIRQK